MIIKVTDGERIRISNSKLIIEREEVSRELSLKDIRLVLIENLYSSISVKSMLELSDNKILTRAWICRKNLLSKGFYQLQESVYICRYNYKTTINLHLAELRMLAPKEANVRMLILTQVQFNSMEVIAGEKNFYENILTQDNLILEL